MRALAILSILLASAAACSAQIHLLLTGGVAGQAIHADALTTQTPLNVECHWDLGDPAGPYDVLNGWNVAHVYSAPGSYRITLTVGQQTFTASIEIAEPTRRTYYVAADGNDANDGRTPDRPWHTLARVAKLTGDHIQVLFHRGDAFGVTQTLRINGHDVIFGAYPVLGSRARPRLVWSGPRVESHVFELERKSADVMVRDLSFDSIYSNDTERGRLPEAIYPAGTNAAVVNCQFLNVAYAVNCELSPTGVLVQDCDAPQVTKDGRILPFDQPDRTTPGINGLRAYFVWVQGNHIVLLGNSVANSTREHCIRIGGAHGILISYNHLQNLDREVVDSQDMAKSVLAAQIGDHLYAAHNVFRDGTVMIGPLNRKDLAHDPARRKDAFSWAVLEDNEFTCPAVFEPGFSHGLVKGNVWSIGEGAACVVNGYSADYDRYVTDLSIVNNSAMLTGTLTQFLNQTSEGKNVRVAENEVAKN
jgi:PKD repeat protein